MKIRQPRTPAAVATPVAAAARPAQAATTAHADHGPRALDHSPRMRAQGAAIAAAFGANVGAPAPVVAQRKPQYARLVPQADFADKHLNANPSIELCSAMLVARKYRGWKGVASKHTIINGAVFPGAWRVPDAGAGYKTTQALKGIERQFIASDPAVVTAGTDWTVKSKNTVRSPAVSGNVVAIAPTMASNGAADMSCSWQMSVDHLAGAADSGETLTKVHWDGVNSQYRVQAGTDAVKTMAQATVEP